METIVLDGTWAVRPDALSCSGEAGLEAVRQAPDGWLPAEVPGEVHVDLIRAGQMPEPTIGTNMPGCRWPEAHSWWYRTGFTLGDGFLRHERQELVFDGLDLYAQVFVNGRLVGEAADAFVPAVFDVRPHLHAGENELIVRLTAGSELARDETPPGQGQPFVPNRAAGGEIPVVKRQGETTSYPGWAGRKWLRKPQFCYGWDWVDALPNIGIWRGVRLEGRSHAILQDLRLDTLRQDGRVLLELEAVLENLHPWSERTCALELEIVPPDGSSPIRRRYERPVPPGRLALRDLIEIPDARLWWPNGMGEQGCPDKPGLSKKPGLSGQPCSDKPGLSQKPGLSEQPLYQVNARLLDSRGAECDRRGFKIGLRTIEIDRSPLAEGSRFCFRVNGEEVFCRGGNIGPQDPILARIPAAKYETLVGDARDAHFTMLRINGCSIFEAPAFYEACDRAGILVWQDFPLTDITYPDDDAAFCTAVQAEIEAAVRRLRHHPSIALWCGNNENAWFFVIMNPDLSKPLDLGGRKLYYQVLPDVCRLLDPYRPYWPSSPCGGEHPNSELEGNCHWWWPAFMNADVNRRIRHEVYDECRARFNTEYGVIGPCHLDSMRTYLSPDEMRPGSAAWQMHTNTFEKETVPAAIRFHYADPEGLPIADYVLYGQMFQAITHGGAMEAMRFRKHDSADDCAGAVIWSYSDCWGETGWSVLDYYLRRKPAYYWLRRACAPLKVIVRQRAGRLVTRLVNDTLQAYAGEVEAGWWRLDGSGRDTRRYPARAPANGMIQVAAEPLPAGEERDPREWLYAAVLRGADGVPVDQALWLLLPFRQMATAAPEIGVKTLPDGRIEVTSAVYCHGVHVEDHGREVISDNWFDLLPGVPKRVRLAEGLDTGSLSFAMVR